MDYQATTPLDPRVLVKMRPFLESENGFGNPHSTEHRFGRDAAAAVADARTSIANLIGASDEEIVFTSGATEANNLAILGVARATKEPSRNEIIVSAIEHKSVLAPARHLEHQGFIVRTVPVDQNGKVDLSHLANAVGRQTRLVSIMGTNNEIGVMQPIRDAADICRGSGALFHVDAAQSLGIAEVDVDDWDVDFMSLSGHKAYGPKGIGALYVRNGSLDQIRPIMFGGGQEDGLRPGTLPAALCVGFGAACEILSTERRQEIVRIKELRDRLLHALTERIDRVDVNGSMHDRHPGSLNIRFVGVDAGQVLAACEGTLAAATGSACTAGMLEPSHVLLAIGRTPAEAEESVRISIGRFTTATEIESAVEALSSVVRRLRQSLDS